MEHEGARVWVVSREQWTRALLVAELAERGLDARGYEDLSAAVVDLYRLFHPTPVVLVMDARDLEPEPAMVRALAACGVRVVVVVGETERNEPWLRDLSGARLLRRPVSIGEVADCVQSLVAEQRPELRNS